MAYSDIVADIKSTIEGVSGTANVYDHLLYVENENERIENVVDNNNKINTWQITRANVNIRAEEASACFVDYEHVIQVHGFYQSDTNGANEPTFNDLVDDVFAAIVQDATFGGHAETWLTNPVVTTESVKYEHALCHHAIIELYPLTTVNRS